MVVYGVRMRGDVPAQRRWQPKQLLLRDYIWENFSDIY